MQSHTVDTHRWVASRFWAEYAVRAMWERHMIEIECDTSMAHGITSWAFSLLRLVFARSSCWRWYWRLFSWAWHLVLSS